MQETIWHSSASTVTFNVGTLYRISANGLHIGASLSNFGTAGRASSGRDLRITYDNDPDALRRQQRAAGRAFTGNFRVPVMFRVGVAACRAS